MYDYVALRKKLLGVDELHFYDLYTPVVSDFDIKINFEQAKETVLKALEPMGEDYLKIIKEGFENRWIDVYENQGKTSGAYSAGARVHPFVLLNHKDTLNCTFTLIHEMGHAVHSYLSNKNQPVCYSDYSIFVAEVASTCNEALLMRYLLKKAEDKKEKAYLINYFLEMFRTTLYRQTMFAEFELKINELSAQGESLTADTLNSIYLELNKLYFGDGIVLDKQISLEWARIPHFYYDYYVYQYATGIAAAIALSSRILSVGESAVKDYIGFLSGGSSKDPISLLRGAGVDMATPEPINEALKVFGDLIKEMDELYK
jgi:oligoendopeptidase F